MDRRSRLERLWRRGVCVYLRIPYAGKAASMCIEREGSHDAAYPGTKGRRLRSVWITSLEKPEIHVELPEKPAKEPYSLAATRAKTKQGVYSARFSPASIHTTKLPSRCPTMRNAQTDPVHPSRETPINARQVAAQMEQRRAITNERIKVAITTERIEVATPLR